MQVDDSHGLDLEYTRTMMGFLLFVPDPRKIAMVGLGGGSLPKFCHRHLPQAQICVLEINPHVIALRDEFEVPPDDDRFRVLLADGARFVRQPDLALDVLMVDGFDSHGMPEGLAAQRFFDDCHAALRPEGLLVVNLHMADKRYDLIVDRIRRSFDDAVLLVEASDHSNSIAFGWRGRSFAGYKPGIARHPAGLEGAAARQLLKAFASVAGALQQQTRWTGSADARGA
ncbi:MAG: fused MFS/spermidine synthase [Ideonella sp.]|nr:fused MFS/spermidine synthase [Ideonella sp.]